MVSRPCDASTSSKIGMDRHHNSDEAEDSEASEHSPPKRAKPNVSEYKLSASEIDSILTAEVPDLGLFAITKVRNSAATHDRLEEKLLKSRFVPSKTWVAPKRQCGQKKRVLANFFNQELYPIACNYRCSLLHSMHFIWYADN